MLPLPVSVLRSSGPFVVNPLNRRRAITFTREVMVKITDNTNYSRFARPASDDEGIWLDHVEVHLVTHPRPDQADAHP